MSPSRSHRSALEAAHRTLVSCCPVFAHTVAGVLPPRAWRGALVAGAALAIAACATSGASTPRRIPAGGAHRVVTATQLARLDATNALGALRQVGGPFRLPEAGGSRPVTATTRRGRSSLVLTEADVTLVMLDGVRIVDLLMLQNVPVSAVRSIEFLSGIQATTRFGTNSGAGAVLITTASDAR